jgi:hypothetical protein
MKPRTLGFAYQRVVVDRLVCAAITLMSVLTISDGWQHG